MRSPASTAIPIRVTYVVLEVTDRAAHGPRHKLANQRGLGSRGGDKKTLTEVLAYGVPFRWPTLCGERGIVYVDGPHFRDVPHCPTCATSSTTAS